MDRVFPQKETVKWSSRCWKEAKVLDLNGLVRVGVGRSGEEGDHLGASCESVQSTTLESWMQELETLFAGMDV